MTTGSLEEISEESYKKLKRACSQFTLQELKKLLDTRDDCFPSLLKSAKIQKVIISNRLEANKANYTNVLEEFLQKCKITPVACTTYLQNLAFQDVMLHQKKVWQVIELIEPNDPSTLRRTEDQIKANIIKKIKAKLQLSALVQIEKTDTVYWCMLIDVKYNRKGVPKYGNPSYFTYTDDQTSLCLWTCKFSSIIDVLVESFGYSSYKRCDLNGKDVVTLHALMAKQRNENPATPSANTSMSRASRNSARYLTAKSIVLQEVHIKCNTEWKGGHTSKKRKRLNSVNSALTLQAPNIGLFVQTLIDDGVITDPRVAWVTKFRNMRSNVISVDEVEEARVPV